MRVLYLCGAGNPEGVRLALTIQRAEGRWDRIVILDDDASRHGISILGVEIAGAFELLRDADPGADEVANLVARTTAKRASAKRKIRSYGVPPASLIHPTVDLTGAHLEPDTTVYPGATIGAGAWVGESSVVFMGAVVGHGARLGTCCVLGPNAVVNARVHLGDGVYVGSNAAVLPDLKIGAGATVAACSAVIEDVPDGASAIGVPAQILVPFEAADPAQARSFDHSTGVGGSELRASIAGVWKEVLHLAEIGESDNFFDLGGASLQAFQALEKTKLATRAELTITDIFRFPTVGLLADYIHSGTSPRGALESAEQRARMRRQLRHAQQVA